MIRKEKQEEKIVFKGVWEVIDKNKIRYSLGLKGDSAFEIKASLLRTGFLGKKNALIYKLGARVSGKYPLPFGERVRVRGKPRITIFGKWRLTRRTGLVFEVRYSRGVRNYLAFGAEVRLNKRDELLFLLKDRKNRPLGVEVILKRRFLGNSGEILFKLLASKEEKSVQLSVGRLF